MSDLVGKRVEFRVNNTSPPIIGVVVHQDPTLGVGGILVGLHSQTEGVGWRRDAKHVAKPPPGVLDGFPFGYWITRSQIARVLDTDSTCRKCNLKNEFAAPNQPDGSYVCYNCR